MPVFPLESVISQAGLKRSCDHKDLNFYKFFLFNDLINKFKIYLYETFFIKISLLKFLIYYKF